MAGFNPADFTVAKAKPLPVVLLLDVSLSMGPNDDENAPINVLNRAVDEMVLDFSNNQTNEIEILLSVITFGTEVKLHLPYTVANQVEWTPLKASGMTPMGGAFAMTKAMIEDKDVTPSRAYRPTLVLVSDGGPNDTHWQEHLSSLVNEGRSQKCDRLAMAIGTSADNRVLNKFIEGTEHTVFQAEDASKIKEFFRFVTMSVTSRTVSQNPNIVQTDNSIEQSIERSVTFLDNIEAEDSIF
ncbi:tellurite resistance protein TerY [Photobacterium iliopiscarium]|uniref:VWA domain-containing protein n=1 Tax=Photobacterium iliopiscarium TaxID=56192 RepID=A0ABX5GT24_9GAMM|nr:VWA domain-containing protein [Photobacterium iliopiscarium]KJG23061.1 tellurite resistance protein TerY [Photobacterium iliopiscarium]PSW96634.1 VWA domain-containing protein [Photobacterium iliopiscarium]